MKKKLLIEPFIQHNSFITKSESISDKVAAKIQLRRDYRCF